MDCIFVPQAGLRAARASLTLVLGLALAMQAAHAGPTDLANIPLANASTVTILPNIMLDLDNSGSMAWNYMPDHVRYTSYDGFVQSCRGPSGRVVCELGDPPYMASEFNSLYYNPATRYVWPVKSNGARQPDRWGRTSYTSPWNSVPSDGYDVQRIEDTSAETPSAKPCYSPIVGGDCTRLEPHSTIDLVNGYPERVWCSSSWDTSTCRSALNTSNVYAFPTSTYKYLHVAKGAPYYYNVSVEWCKSQDSKNQNFGKEGTCQPRKTGDYQYIRYYNWSRVSIVPGGTYPKAVTRTDCAGANSCSYDEEMANFANWYAWYRTRAQMTKSAIGLSFEDVRGTPNEADLNDANFLHARIGLTTINSPAANKLDIDNFDKTQKDSFFTKLYAFKPSGGTPLRKSLKSVGEMYAGDTATYADPLKFSCQKNYTILATDGYWNDGVQGEEEGGEFVPPDADATDQDGAASRPSKDDLGTPNTLADVAYYYYHTDLRTGCTGKDLCTNNVSPSGASAEVDDVAQHQHMTTFTIGLGVDGTLEYDPNYKNSKSGDYFNIKQGTSGYYWPAPAKNTPETIDDLWHAAVNGRGTYFSAQSPTALESGLRKALGSIESKNGSGAAAATSNLQPTAGDNFIYVATYRTVKWDAEVSAYSIDLTKGTISANPIWQAEPLLRAKIGTTGTSDSRTIYTGKYDANGNLTRTLFSSGTGGLTAAQLAMFDPKKLSQASAWTTTQSNAATPASLVSYLRGQDRNEDQERGEGYGDYNRIYRDREKVLGDIVHAQPIYVRKSQNSFTDAGFSNFKSSVNERAPTLYVAANDGMLHAFDGATGQERWAFIPPQLLPDMWRLADVNYETKHRYYLDGPLTINDVQIGGAWRTVLIGAMGKGGRGYYALDVTDPANPVILWDFTADKNPRLGYTYGTPLVTKRKDGKWVAVLASGYNNIPEVDESGATRYATADGGGYVFVLDLADGSLLSTIATGVGSSDNPSGLAWLNARVDDFGASNTALVVYGGDLTGKMWRFNLDDATASQLADIGINQPIMAAPEIGEIELTETNKIPVVYFGSGRYLGKGDLDDIEGQTLYGIKDTGSNKVSGKTGLKAASASGTGTTRSVTGASLSWQTDSGWYLDLIDRGERLTLHPQLYFGTVVFSTTVPSISECQPGGYSWMYQLDHETGGAIDSNPGALKFASPVVGQTVSKLPNGTPIIHAVTADGKKPNPNELKVSQKSLPPKRVLWREVTN